jgi:hypothetical protein
MNDDEMWNLWNSHGIDEMNQQEAIAFARAAIAAHEAKQTAEPVAWARYPRFTGSLQRQEVVFNRPTDGDWTPLYTNPQPAKREPLTPEQIRKWWGSENGLEDCVMTKIDDFTQVVRAIEAAHGITKDTP